MSGTTSHPTGRATTTRTCATFDAHLPGRVLTTLTVTRASDGVCVLRTAALESWELRETLPWVHQQYPRGEGWAITLDAKVVNA